MKELFEIINVIAGLFTIFASGIAIYLFFSKKKVVKSLFKLLIGYSYQITLSEVKEKLERLNDYNAKEPEHLDIIVNLLSELLGQVNGNNKLKHHFIDITREIEVLISDRRKMTEPRKRRIVSELREKIRHLNVSNIDDLIGDTHE